MSYSNPIINRQGWKCCVCVHYNPPDDYSCGGCGKPRWLQLGWTEFEKVGVARIRELARSINRTGDDDDI